MKIVEKVVMYKIERRGGGQKSYTMTDPINDNTKILDWEEFIPNNSYLSILAAGLFYSLPISQNTNK